MWNKIENLFIVLVTALVVYFASPFISRVLAFAGLPTSTQILGESHEPFSVSVDFGSVLKEEAKQEKSLTVMTQDLSVSENTSKEGLFGWSVFRQTQAAVFHGESRYEVDLAQLSDDSFTVDEENHVITITVPYPTLSVEYLPEESEFFDTANGLLTFGEMKLSLEEANELAVLAKEKLQTSAESDTEMWEMAEKYAKMSVRDIYQPVVNAAVNAAVEEAGSAYAMPVVYTVQVELADKQ